MSNEFNVGGSSNFILAEGKRTNPFGLWWLAAIGLMTALICALIAFIILLSRPVSIPASDALFVTAPPKSLATISPSLLEALPSEIREIIHTGSSWPITFGLYRSKERWQWFMVGPSWMIKDGDTTNGLVSLFASEMNNTEETRNFKYTKSLSTILPFRETVSIEIEPQLLADASGLNISLNEPSIKGTFVHGMILFDIPFESEQQNPPLHTADLALTIPKNGITEDALKDFIRRLSNGRHHHLNIPGLSQYHVWIDENGHPTLSKYSFEKELSEEDAAQLLGAYGFFSKKAVLLPDGTLSYEHVVPTTSSSDGLFGEHANEQGELITLNHQELFVQTPNQTQIEFDTILPCNNYPRIRLSGKSLDYILTSLGAIKIPEKLPNLQVGSYNDRLSICFE